MALDPYWRYVRKIGSYSGGGGSRRWKCSFCGYEKTGSVTRVKDHLAKVVCKDIAPCMAVPDDVFAALQGWRKMRLGIHESTDRDESQDVGDSMPSTMPCSSNVSMTKRQRSEEGTSEGPSAIRTPLPKGPNVCKKGSLREASLKASMQKVHIKEATKEMRRLFIQCAIPFNVARTTQWKRFVKATSRIGYEWEGPSGETLRTTELKREKACIMGQLDYLQDAWKKYGCSILCDRWSDIRKRSVYNVLISSCMGTMFWRAIDASATGLTVTTNVIQVITDNGSNCLSMGNILQDEYKKIVWTPCASHCLDLLMEDIGKIEWVCVIFKRAKSIVKMVTKRPKVLSMYRANSTLEILKPSATQFAYMFIVLERLIRVRPNLIRTISSEERNILDEDWWLSAEALVKTLQPIYIVLRITDMQGSTLGLLYEYMDKIGESLSKNTYLAPEKIESIRDVWNARWNWFHKPIHAVPYILHPLWRGPHQLGNDELDSDGDIDMQTRIEDEMLVYRNHRGKFGKATTILRESQLRPVSWWENMKRLALRVLSQDYGARPCERNWSTRSLFHTKKRNKLTPRQLEDLVFCNANLALLEKISYSPDPMEVNVDTINLDQTLSIPDIPTEERDIYALLYEESFQFVHDTRSRRRGDPSSSAYVQQRVTEHDDSSSSSSAASSDIGDDQSDDEPLYDDDSDGHGAYSQ
ncbi:hypothetical protein KP509_28G024800 [Ceratopteris richardii]|uniref:DUF659 domain-containing protein n=1 Tax=Ceratopteris richardii TaxID=49495 RepID=A0A8T2RD08_CERRI|nr:hypothetical protein KP509_28G024800 [Ceratopteris richardii]